MVKFTHIFVMSVLIFGLAVSGCVGNNNDEKENGPAPNASVNNTSVNQGLTEAEVQEFDENVTDLKNLLENSSIEEEIVVEEL